MPKPPARDRIEAAKNVVMTDLALLDAEIAVGGGLNPRESGAWVKTGTKLAVGSTLATKAGSRPLSMPSAAAGGGRRPTFTRVYHLGTIGHRGR